MVNHAEEAPHILPEQWTPVARLDELPDGEPTRRTLGGVPVFVLRRGQQVDVLYDLCSHLSGPLSEGELSGAGDEMCITCPWHGSTFRLRDGQVQRGPTTYPQPVLQVRVDPDGSVQARLREED
jgi:nitrite reductase/ring-hydroxylating ferredoxin subunit